ncbi:YrhK family protein [Cellulomonas fimi]|uniref:YrhK family protein n=1 Tax=Cellulomonas fimi TaxID=1708 RepID=UPI00234C219A|nr:YrhK family protein [Cellulomonas fimi]MDC7122141.1 YrhK family protein [Cellulomonas fimi]
MTRTSALPDLPDGWTAVDARGPGPFVTHAVLRRPDGAEVEWTSRRHRKGLGLRAPAAAAPTAAGGHRGADAWSWWIGALFAIGSVCFALGSLPAYVDAVAPAVTAWTFAVGSVFFTSAAYLQYDEAARAPRDVLATTPPRGRLAALVGFRPDRIDLWASAVQLVGTVLFNVSTFSATRAGLAVAGEKTLVWAPDVLGSVCFLVASWFAYAEVNRGALPRPDRSVGWTIAALNLAGSIAFGVAAVAARYLHGTDEMANVALVNAGTFVGAVCFLVGAVLLPVESARDRAPAAADGDVVPHHEVPSQHDEGPSPTVR